MSAYHTGRRKGLLAGGVDILQLLPLLPLWGLRNAYYVQLASGFFSAIYQLENEFSVPVAN